MRTFDVVGINGWLVRPVLAGMVSPAAVRREWSVTDVMFAHATLDAQDVSRRIAAG